jgi:diketogulonate reductase-like aldo/keto reductase
MRLVKTTYVASRRLLHGCRQTRSREILRANMSYYDTISRRQVVGALGVAAAATILRPLSGLAQTHIITKAIPSTGQRIPVVGLGTWITFNVGDDPELRDECAAVMKAFFDSGGGMIDSSPMYGSSQSVIGYGLSRLPAPARLFSADKVWTSAASRGPEQIEDSRKQWRVQRFDLLQVHNLLAWEEHLPMLLAMKKAGGLTYVGVTTSEGRRHDEIERIMATQPIDFVQITYNPLDREAEARILPLARERGIAVIANRPFEQGDLLRALARHALPPVAAELQCTSWAQFALKFVVSHPAVTCAIPATTSVAHVRENMAAGTTNLPDLGQRNRMAAQTASLL